MFAEGERTIKTNDKNQRVYWHLSILGLMLLLISLLSCEGSDTRSEARSSTSGDYEINVQITTPTDGSTIVFADSETTTEFNAVVNGGTEPIGLTWLVKGPTTESTST